MIDRSSLPDRVIALGAPDLAARGRLTDDGRWLVPRVTALPNPSADQARQVVVILDSGIDEAHPSLRGRVIEHHDVTGQGVQDDFGHGTAVAAIFAASTAPWTSIISVKALDRNGEIDLPTFCLGLRTAATVLKGRGRVINISAGRRSATCAGDCPICSTARELQDTDGFMLVCASGNLPGVTYCPARVAIAVGSPEPNAAPGDVVAPVPEWVTEPG